MKIKKIFLILSILLFSCLLYSYTHQPKYTELQNEFEQKASKALEEKDQILVSELTPFKWEEVCLFRQDDSDDGLADNEFKKMLRKYGIDYLDKNQPRNPLGILTFRHENNLIVFYEPSMNLRKSSFYINNYNGEASFNCISYPKAFLQIKENNKHIDVRLTDGINANAD